MSKLPIIAVSAFVIVIASFAIFQPGKDTSPKLGQLYEDQGQKHLKTETESHEPYNSNLPTSGPHAPAAPWGVYDTKIADETFIHNLEHGGIVIAYKPDLPADQVAKLKMIAENITKTSDGKSKKGFKVILTPREKNIKPVQVAAWKYNMSLDTVDKAKIEEFYRDHLNNAPESKAV